MIANDTTFQHMNIKLKYKKDNINELKYKTLLMNFAFI